MGKQQKDRQLTVEEVQEYLIGFLTTLCGIDERILEIGEELSSRLAGSKMKHQGVLSIKVSRKRSLGDVEIRIASANWSFEKEDEFVYEVDWLDLTDLVVGLVQ